MNLRDVKIRRKEREELSVKLNTVLSHEVRKSTTNTITCIWACNICFSHLTSTQQVEDGSSDTKVKDVRKTKAFSTSYRKVVMNREITLLV